MQSLFWPKEAFVTRGLLTNGYMASLPTRHNTAACRHNVIALSHRWHLRQNCLVLSCPCREYEHNWPQDNGFVSSRPSFQFATVQSQICSGLLKTWNFETGTKLIETMSRQDKTVLPVVVFTPPTRTRQDSLVLSMSTVWTSHNRAVLWYTSSIGST